MQRSNVDLPQPDGPTKTTNSPSLISRSTFLEIKLSPYALHTFRKVTLVIVPIPLLVITD